MKYFVFNKTSDYERGYGEHVSYQPSGIVSEEEYLGKAAFFSRIMDSTEDGTIWHRMTGVIQEGSSASIRISFYTSDRILFEEEEGTLDLRQMLRSKEMTLSEKKELCRPFLRKQMLYSEDILLHGLEGRYMWFLLEIYQQSQESVSLGEFMIYFPAESWLKYLPEIYRQEMGNNSFLDRYLAIFQSLYDDVGRQIRSVKDYLLPASTTSEFLEWLASWLDVEEPYMWKDEQLRFLLEHIMEFYEARGTKKGIELFVELYTGQKPFVIEWQDWAKLKEQKEYGRLLNQLYIDDPSSFMILVSESCIPSYKEHQTLLRILNQIKPVQMEVHLIVLEPYIFADGYSYLGISSVLGQYEEAVLGESSRLEFSTMTRE